MDRGEARKALLNRIKLRLGAHAHPAMVEELSNIIVERKLEEGEIKQIWLVTEETCPACEAIKNELVADLEAGSVKVVDVGDEKGYDIVTKLDLMEVPMLVVELQNGQYLRYVEE